MSSAVSTPPVGALRMWLLLGAVMLAFIALTGVTGDTECAVDGMCEFGIPLRWVTVGNAFETVGAFILDLALFLSLVPAALALRGPRAALARGWLSVVVLLLSLFTVANWSGKLGLRMFLRLVMPSE